MGIKDHRAQKLGSIPVAGSPASVSGRDPMQNPGPQASRPSAADRTYSAPYVTADSAQPPAARPTTTASG